jgi:hypothetical protein
MAARHGEHKHLRGAARALTVQIPRRSAGGAAFEIEETYDSRQAGDKARQIAGPYRGNAVVGRCMVTRRNVVQHVAVEHGGHTMPDIVYKSKQVTPPSCTPSSAKSSSVLPNENRGAARPAASFVKSVRGLSRYDHEPKTHPSCPSTRGSCHAAAQLATQRCGLDKAEDRWLARRSMGVQRISTHRNYSSGVNAAADTGYACHRKPATRPRSRRRLTTRRLANPRRTAIIRIRDRGQLGLEGARA